MNARVYRTILYTVGALPFWTGKQKLIDLLDGNPGSFWNHESPLKPVYLNQPFFGDLQEHSSSEIRQSLQKLLQSRHLVHEPVSGDKPYRVVKFSDKGVKKYYNLLVREREITEPYWWIHHLSRLEETPNSPINTGGELLVYNESLNLTQAPAYRSDTERMQSDQTLSLRPGDQLDEEVGHFEFRGLRVDTRKNVRLVVTNETTVERAVASDLGEKLNHFGTGQSQVNPPNPYVIRGTLVNVTDPDEDGHRYLELRNDEGDELRIQVATSQIPEELSLEEGTNYVLGPLSESEAHDNQFTLTLASDGEINAQRL